MWVLATENSLDLDNLFLEIEGFKIVGYGNKVDFRRKLVGCMAPVTVGENAELTAFDKSDKTLLENIMHLAQETIPQIDLTSTEMTKTPDVFCLRLHLSNREALISLQQLRSIQAYSPARILDVQVAVLPETVQVLVRVASETSNIMYSEVDVIRITKRTRAI